MNYSAISLCAFLLFSACGRGDSQPAPKVFEEQRNVLGKTKAVDAEQQQHEEEKRKALEQQTR